MKPRARAALFMLAGGLAAISLGPLLIPVPPLRGTFAPKELADADAEFIEIMGRQIHVKKAGQGNPVFVLLHGFAASVYSWHVVMQPFSQLGTVIAYDRVGFGLSERPLAWSGQNPYSAEAQVETLMGLLEHFGVDRAILVGNSAGGMVSMQAALAHPEKVVALILVDAAVYVGSRTPAWLKPVLFTPQMRHLGPLISRQLVRFGPDLIKLAWHDPSQLPAEMIELYRRPFLVHNWDRALWEFTMASRPSNLTDHLQEFSLPVLVITGDDDRIVPTRDSIRLARELPNASLVVIKNAGHLPHEENPQVFMQEVKDFVQKLEIEI